MSPTESWGSKMMGSNPQKKIYAAQNVKPFWEAPDKKLGVENDGHGPTNVFTWPKMRKSFLKAMYFCKIC